MIYLRLKYQILILAITSLVLLACVGEQKGIYTSRPSKSQKSQRGVSKKHNKKLAVSSKKDKFQLVDIFVSQQKQNEVKCPSKVKKKANEYGKVSYPKDEVDGSAGTDEVMIIRRSREIEFDIVHIEEKKLNIPAFKQFKNNMTDFTRGGEEQFKEIIIQIKEYLGDNTDGEGVTLFITGCASQIPTSFDPSKPNNNINSDGTSIHGETSVENNRLLALARATELANKIQSIFKNIKIVVPTLSEIELGKTQWTHAVQKELDAAFLTGDKGKMMEVFEPFQKEQFVKVESHETFMKTVQPNSIKMYTVSFVPRIVRDGNEIKGALVVSAETFWSLGPNRKFSDANERDKYLKEVGLELVSTEINGEQRWMLTGSKAEKNAVKTKGDYEKILRLHEFDMVNEKDRDVLETIITEKYLKENKFKYILKEDAFSKK